MWIEIFRSGKHTDSTGKTTEFPTKKIQMIADKYNAKIKESSSYEAPLVKGHPKNNEPAKGWIEQLVRRGDKLMAKVKNASSDIIEAVRSKQYQKVSVSLYPDLMLRHVGLLGAAPPAVKGLRNVELSEDENYKVLAINKETTRGNDNHEESNDTNDPVNKNEYTEKLESENKTLKRKINDLEMETKRKEFKEFAESLSDGLSGLSLPPAKITELTQILEMAEIAENKNFTETRGLKKKIMDFFKNFDVVDLGTKIEAPIDVEEKLPFNSNYDEKRLDLHKKALEIQSQSPELTYEEAVLTANSQILTK